MQKRKIGSQGFTVSALAFGAIGNAKLNDLWVLHQALPTDADRTRAAIDALEAGVRGGPEPEIVTLQNFHRDIPEA